MRVHLDVAFAGTQTTYKYGLQDIGKTGNYIKAGDSTIRPCHGRKMTIEGKSTVSTSIVHAERRYNEWFPCFSRRPQAVVFVEKEQEALQRSVPRRVEREAGLPRRPASGGAFVVVRAFQLHVLVPRRHGFREPGGPVQGLAWRVRGKEPRVSSKLFSLRHPKQSSVIWRHPLAVRKIYKPSLPTNLKFQNSEFYFRYTSTHLWRATLLLTYAKFRIGGSFWRDKYTFG